MFLNYFRLCFPHTNFVFFIQIKRVNGRASFAGDKIIHVSNGEVYSGKHILIATGGQASTLDIPGKVRRYV